MLARALALCCPVVVTAASFHIETDNVPAVPVARRRDPTVERWGLYELALSGPAAAPTVSAGTGTGSAAAVSAQLGVVANPFEVELTATFTEQTTTKMQQLHVAGFFDGGTSYRVRFSPPTEGDWCWQTTRRSVDTPRAPPDVACCCSLLLLPHLEAPPPLRPRLLVPLREAVHTSQAAVASC